jgi:hypothetical protein
MSGYLTIIDLGTDGAITVLYPQPGQDNRIAAGQTLRLPPTGSFYALPPFGRGIVRAFVTQRPLDLHFTGQGASDASGVAAALRSAAGAVSEAVPVTTWSTSALVYTIRKK